MKKKVLILSSKISPSIGGVEVVVDSLGSKLNEKYDVRVLTNVYRTSQPGLKELAKYLKEFILNPINHLKAVLGIGYELHGYKVVETYFIFWGISLTRNILSFLFVPPMIIHFVYHLFLFRPDIVNLHFADNAAFYALLSKILMPQITLVSSFHGSDITKFADNSRFHKRLIGSLIGKSDKVLFVSSRFKDDALKKFAINDNKVQVVHNGIDTRAFKENRKFNRLDNVILFVGRLRKVKGVDILIDAFKRVQESRKDLKLVIVGDGQERSNLEKQALGYNIEFVGMLDHEETIKYYSQATFSVIPSRYEQFGIVAIEAMSCNCPVIVSRVGALQDIIEDDINGLSFEKDNVEQLAEKMSRLLENEKFRDRLSANGLRTVDEKYTVERFIDCYINAYEG